MSQYRLVSISQQTSRIPLESGDVLGAVVASLACAPVDCRGITGPVVLCSHGILDACDDLGLLAGFFSTMKAILCCGENVKALLTLLFSTCHHLSELLRCFCSHSKGTACSHLRPRAVLRVSLYLKK